IYRLTSEFPRAEQYGLTAQLRRAAVSIPSDIAEGHHHTTKAYRHFVTMALGSQAECATQLELAKRLGLATASAIDAVADDAFRLGRVLHGLSRSLRERARAKRSG